MKWRAWAAGIAALAALGGGMLVQTYRVQIAPAASPAAAREIQWILDAGHGGEDGGAVSVSGVPESQVNLSIALRLDQILGLLGQPALLLRDEDVSLHTPEAETLREKKRSDLMERVRMVNELPEATLISLHQNSFPQGQYWGTQLFWAPTDGSMELAKELQTLIQENLQPENRRAAKEVDPAVYLMNHVQGRAVLVECGFLSNPEEEALLLSPAYQTKVAAVLALGCVKNAPVPG